MSRSPPGHVLGGFFNRRVGCFSIHTLSPQASRTVAFEADRARLPLRGWFLSRSEGRVSDRGPATAIEFEICFWLGV